MRFAQGLLLVSVVVTLVGVVYVAERLVQAEANRIMFAGRLATRANLESEAITLRFRLEKALTEGPVRARYTLDGRLLRPAPPAVARAFETPARSLSSYHLAQGRLDEANAAATTSAERARVALARKDWDAALREPSVEGTELAYLIRRERFRARGESPDEAWRDDVSALLGGPSDRFGRMLLAEAGLEPVSTHAERAFLNTLPADESLFRYQRQLFRGDVGPEGPVLLMRSVPIPELPEGSVKVRMPKPFDMLEMGADPDRSAWERELADRRRRIYWLYGGAAGVIVLGSLYALLAMSRARRYAEAKSDFVANVTHELKTPLANIRLHAETLQAGRARTDEDRARFLQTILDEEQRLESLVDGLLHVSRGPRLERQPVDPAALLRETEERWQPRLRDEGFALELDATALPEVRADREALGRALDNLIDNARKYGREDPRIELTGTASNGHVRLAVRDYGPGIPAGQRADVLRPFARLERADRKETPGTGLGLSLVQSTMEAHGGRVEVHAAAGGGARVELVLPVGGTA
ncbi:MAG: HAMP domain-containing sensor histidine kinase [Planctomycetota bacterium]